MLFIPVIPKAPIPGTDFTISEILEEEIRQLKV